jgi:UDP-N-acetylglucosamine diphosphorylase/glucosamine-1-phosphate N-acetyltransferase
MNIILTDFRENWLNLLPLSFTRPVSKFRIGIFTLDEKWKKYLGSDCSYITEDYLSEKYSVKLTGDNLLINSIVLPDKMLTEKIRSLGMNEVLIENELLLAVRVSSKEVNTIRNLDLTGFHKIQYEGEISCIKNLWDIFLLNASEIRKDVELIRAATSKKSISKTNVIIGNPDDLILEDGVSAECVVFNVTDGPIYIGKNTLIMEGSMLKGPIAIGEYSMIKMGAKIYQGTTIGPYCRAAGEINNSVFFGYSNKAHEGFLGNAVLGEWCNLGADTNNSNLKNNYEAVKVWNYHSNRFVNTGLTFCGLFMADHSKCSINTMFNTGTVVGVSANIFGCGFPRTFIPSFSWGGSAGFTDYNIEKAIETATKVMHRREIDITDQDIEILRVIFNKTIDYRKL